MQRRWRQSGVLQTQLNVPRAVWLARRWLLRQAKAVQTCHARLARAPDVHAHAHADARPEQNGTRAVSFTSLPEHQQGDTSSITASFIRAPRAAMGSAVVCPDAMLARCHKETAYTAARACSIAPGHTTCGRQSQQESALGIAWGLAAATSKSYLQRQRDSGGSCADARLRPRTKPAATLGRRPVLDPHRLTIAQLVLEYEPCNSTKGCGTRSRGRLPVRLSLGRHARWAKLTFVLYAGHRYAPPTCLASSRRTTPLSLSRPAG